MATHYLKTWPEHFKAVQDGSKRAELRLNDRDFKVGDTLVLQEYSPGGLIDHYDVREYHGHRQEEVEPFYTDSSDIRAEVTHILHGGEFGLEKRYMMMSIELK